LHPGFVEAHAEGLTVAALARPGLLAQGEVHVSSGCVRGLAAVGDLEKKKKKKNENCT
jgi:hypothetical protein